MEKTITIQEELETLAISLLRKFAVEYTFIASTKDGQIYDCVFRTEDDYKILKSELDKLS